MGAKAVGGGLAGGGLAALVVYVSQRLGGHLNADDASGVVLVVTVVGAFVGHHGIVGVAKLIWRGSKDSPPTPPTA